MTAMNQRDNERFKTAGFSPAYIADDVRTTLAVRAGQATEALTACRSCPRNCSSNRMANETKVCHTGRYARVSAAFAHYGEEACLSGWRGSGTIFFSACNLRCVYCQNWDISQRPGGEEMNAEMLAGKMIELQLQGCHNINLVTPSHVVPQIVEALVIAIERGLTVPVVYNSSAYDSIESLRMLAGLIDVYMPDFKFWSSESAERYSKAKDYPDRAREAIHEMHRQVGDLHFNGNALACHGLLVRHLVLPDLIEESRAIFRFLATQVSTDTYVNIMGQYRPEHHVGTIATTGQRAGSVQYVQLNRRVRPDELASAYQAAQEVGLWRFDRPHSGE